MLDKGELTCNQLHLPVDTTSLPPPKKGRPTLLGDQEKSVMEYILALRRAGGVVNSAIRVGVADAVMSWTYPLKTASSWWDCGFHH